MNASDELREMEAQASQAPAAQKMESPWGPQTRLTEKRWLRGVAGNVATAGWLFIGAAVLGAVFAGIVAANSSGGQAVAIAYIAGGAFGLGLWMHLIAQLIYIRAALEKE